MQRLRYLFAGLALLTCLAAGAFAYKIGNPILGIGALVVTAVATGFAARYYSKHVIAPNLKKAETSPAIRSDPLSWLLRLAMMSITLGIAGFLSVSQHRAEMPDYQTYFGIAGALVAAGVGLMIVVVVMFKAANRP